MTVHEHEQIWDEGGICNFMPGTFVALRLSIGGAAEIQDWWHWKRRLYTCVQAIDCMHVTRRLIACMCPGYWLYTCDQAIDSMHVSRTLTNLGLAYSRVYKNDLAGDAYKAALSQDPQDRYVSACMCLCVYVCTCVCTHTRSRSLANTGHMSATAGLGPGASQTRGLFACIYILHTYRYVCMYVYIYAYIYTYRYMYIHTCTHIHTGTERHSTGRMLCFEWMKLVKWLVPMWVCMYVCVYVCLYVCADVNMYVCMYVCMCRCECVCMYVCMYVCMCRCEYVCIH